MLDESKPGQLSLEPGKRERKRSHGRHKLKSTASGAESSPHQSHASSTDNRLPKPEAVSLPTALQEKAEEIVEVSQVRNSDTISASVERTTKDSTSSS